MWKQNRSSLDTVETLILLRPEEYNISNYAIYQEINAFSANMSDVTINEMACENEIHYIEEDYLVDGSSLSD